MRESQVRSTITDKQVLKAVLNQVEMRPYNRQNNQYDIDAVIRPDQDDFERKNLLLEKRLNVLEKTTVKTWNRIFPVFNIIAILSISGMQFGYGIIQITTVFNQYQLLKIYNISLPYGLGIGLMVSLMPIGAVFGNILGKLIIRNFSLKISHHIVNCLCMVSSFALMQINLPATIFTGRFLYGFCIACYCAWSPSIWVVGAMMLGYFFGTVFYEARVDSYYRIMFCVPGGLALIQMILMLIFVPNSPVELFQRGRHEEARIVVEGIYRQEFIDMMIDRYRLEAQVRRDRQQRRYQLRERGYRQGRFRARFMGIYLNIFRQLVGINTVLVYAGLIIGISNYSLGSYTNLIMTTIAFVCTVLSHVFLADRWGRKLLILISTVVFAICNILIMIGLLTNTTYLTFVAFIFFMLVFGLTYSIVSSIYPAQILKFQRVSYTSLTAWPAMVLATLIPPVVADVIQPTHVPWPVFLFYGVYSILSALYIGFCAVQSKDKQYSDILKQF